MPASAASRALRSSRSAASGITPPVEDGLRASPYTVQPCFSSSAARLPPTIPVLPAIKATRPVVMFLLAPPTADTSGLIYHEFSPSWDPLRFFMLRMVSSKPQAVDSEEVGTNRGRPDFSP